jgi:hypothetical protein
MRKYPEPSDYQAAIQNPHLVFRRPELQACRVRLNPLGMPVVSSGGFALSFYLQAPDSEQWVVRCFKADSPDRRARYDAISRFLNDHPDPLLLDVDYYEQGILVNGDWYPVVKMPLVRGVTLHRYIEHELGQGRSSAHLSDKLRAAVDTLQRLGVAHGDLQHGNIMVQNGQLVLVDYDGMYVPAMRGWSPAEIGSANYQHPLRKKQFGPDLDRFSAIVIDVALQALAVRPDLWAKCHTGENLLLRRADFLKPHESALLAELEQIPHLRDATASLRAICQGPVEATPPLAAVLPPLPAGMLPRPVMAGAAYAGTEDDIDEQLNRLYASWTPAPAPAAPINSAPPVTAATAAPPAPPPTSAQEDNWQEVAGLLRMLPKILRIIWFTVFFSLTFGRMMLGGLVDLVTPDPIPVPTPKPTLAILRPVSVDDLRSQTVAAVCPTDLYVSLAEPRGVATTSVLYFVWRSSKSLTLPCRYKLKIWRAGEPPMFITADNWLKWDGSTYTMQVFMHLLLPDDQQEPGTFYWTVELGIERSSSDPIPTHGAPLEFYWKPMD